MVAEDRPDRRRGTGVIECGLYEPARSPESGPRCLYRKREIDASECEECPLKEADVDLRDLEEERGDIEFHRRFDGD